MDNRVIIKDLIAKSLNNRKKTIRIILPKDYYVTNKTYPVLYMHDGQNLIDPSVLSNQSWEVISSVDKYHDKTEGVIIVGIDSDPKYRVLEYSPYIAKKVKKQLRKSLDFDVEEIIPLADQYGDFIVNQLKPIIDTEFRTINNKENTFIAGSSCGGIISLYLGIKYSNIFSCIGSFSTAFEVTKGFLFKFIRDQDIKNYLKIYIDMGTKESGLFSHKMVLWHHRFKRLLSKYIEKKKLLSLIDKGATHTEKYWADRFKYFLLFCFKKMDIK